MSRIGVFGGSFSPVHAGHLRLARRALSELNLDRVVFVPSARTPLKKPDVLWPASLRLRLLKEAVRGQKGLDVSDCEIRRGGISYTIDTLRFFRKKYGRSATLYFLTGLDAARGLKRWKSWRRVLRECRFVACSRPGSPRRLPEGVLFFPFDALDVSASEVRARLARGLSVRGMVPDRVARTLKTVHLKTKLGTR